MESSIICEGMRENMIASKYVIRCGVGRSDNYLPSFDKALLEAGVGNYNLVRLSSILPAKCKRVEYIDLPEGSLLPTAYATETSDVCGETVTSVIGVGIPKDENSVGVIMEYSCKGFSARKNIAMHVLEHMIKEAFDIRGWELKEIISDGIEARVDGRQTCTTFACIAEWE